MADFPMCRTAGASTRIPADRRFHAEPTCCPACGPRLSMPLEEAVALLGEGAILAVKGLGGYHLACDAANEAAVSRLRARKRREEKPFALMTPAAGLARRGLQGRAGAAPVAGNARSCSSAAAPTRRVAAVRRTRLAVARA